MSKIPWFFIWSEKYGVFCDIVTSSISDKYFDLYPIEKDQSLFDKVTYQEGHHFLSGMYLKIYEKYNLLNGLPKNEYFIFSDVDLVVFEDELFEFIKPLVSKINNVDMYFMKETNDTVNIGFMIIKNTQKVKDFFKNIIEDLEKRTTPILDQTIVNQHLKKWDGTYEVLSEKHIASSVNINFNIKENRSNVCIYQPLCTASNNYKINILEKIICIKYLFNINLDNYIGDLSKDLNESDKEFIKIITGHFTSSTG